MFSTIWNTHKLTTLGRVERGYGVDTGNLVEKKESPDERSAVKAVSSLPSKMGTDDWVLKGTKLIANTKKQRLKI